MNYMDTNYHYHYEKPEQQLLAMAFVNVQNINGSLLGGHFRQGICFGGESIRKIQEISVNFEADLVIG